MSTLAVVSWVVLTVAFAGCVLAATACLLLRLAAGNLTRHDGVLFAVLLVVAVSMGYAVWVLCPWQVTTGSAVMGGRL